MASKARNSKPHKSKSEARKSKARKALDPVVTEIVRNGVIAITGEMKTNLMRTAYNMIIYEALDFTTGLFTADGQTISIGIGLPMFIRGMAETIKAELKHFGTENIHPGDILITVGGANSWRAVGDEVREALGEALLDRQGWTVDESPVPAAELARIAAELLAGPVGAIAASHGGSIELVAVAGYHVTVRMAGACDGCPASATTLRDVFERELRQRVGERVEVSSENDSAAISFGKKLLSLIVR